MKKTLLFSVILFALGVFNAAPLEVVPIDGLNAPSQAFAAIMPELDNDDATPEPATFNALNQFAGSARVSTSPPGYVLTGGTWRTMVAERRRFEIGWQRV